MGNDRFVYVDFDKANMISNDMSCVEKEALSIKASFSNITSLTRGKLFPSTNAYCTKIETTLNDIIKNMVDIHSRFDQTIDSYCKLENEFLSCDTLLTTDVSDKNIINKQYCWKTDLNGSRMSRMTNSEIIDALTNKNWVKEGSVYVKDGYRCYVSGQSCRITYQGEQVCCSLYKTPNTSVSNINNSVTFIGGSGQSGGGSNYYLDQKISINDNVIVSSLFHGNNNTRRISTDQIVTATNFVDDLFDLNNNPHSIVGFSAGGISAAETVSKNKGMYNNLVMVNSATFGMESPGVRPIDIDDYSCFDGTNIVYLECNAGWGNNKGVTNSINDLINNGVDASKISLITNDMNLVNDVSTTKINIDSSVPTIYNKHASAWDMMRDSSIFEDLTK